MATYPSRKPKRPRKKDGDVVLNLKQLAEKNDASDEFKALMEKCGTDIAYWRPWGGAVSFADIDEIERAGEIRYEADELTYKMSAIIGNVMDGEFTPAEREQLITAAAREYSSRAGDLASIDAEDVKQEGLVGRILTKLGIKATPAPAAVADPLADYLESDTSQWGSMIVTKDASGAYRWLAVYSNKYYDKDNEVFPESEHKDFMRQLDAGAVPMPELWLWHTPGTRIGQADWADYSSEGFALASGGFDPGMEDVAEKLAADKDLGVSHGFKFRERDSARAIKGYRSFEISPLPRGREANAGTSFSAALKEATVLSQAKKTFLEEKLGADRVKQVEAALGVMATEMTNKGVSFKEVMDDFLTTPQGSPAGGADKSVPPSSNSGTPPGATTAAPVLDVKALQEAVAAGVKEAVAPLEARFGEVEQRMKAIDPSWTPKVNPGASAQSVENKETNVSPNDPIAAIVAEANKAMGAAEGLDGDPAPIEGIGPVSWHMRTMLGGADAAPGAVAAAPSANGSAPGA